MTQLNFMLPNTRVNGKLQVQFDGKMYDLEEHTSKSLMHAKHKNKALQIMPEEELSKVNYYFKLKEEEIPQDRLSRIQIISKDDKFKLPILHHFSFYIPKKHRLIYIKNKIEKYGLRCDSKSDALGINTGHLCDFTNSNLMDIFADGDDVLTPFDIAKSILFQHPNLANRQPYTASIVMNDHIAPSRDQDPEQYNKVYQLAMEISAQGPDKWSARKYAKNQITKEPLTYEYDVLGHKKGDKLEIYSISDRTLSASKSPLSSALNSSSQDYSLKGTSWHLTHGKNADTKDEEAKEVYLKSKPEKIKASDSNGVQWTLNEDTWLPGLYSYKDSISFDSNNNFSMEVKNVHLRTLGAYVQFLDDSGKPISTNKDFIRVVGAVGTIMGIPVPFSKTDIDFKFNKDASAAKLLFGSLGTSNFDWDVDTVGAVLTSIFQFAIPSFFLAVDCLMASNEFFNKSLEDAEFVKAVIELFLGMAQVCATSAKPEEMAMGFLENAAEIAAGMLVSKIMEKILVYIIAQITVEEAENCIPIAGQIMQIAGIVADVAQLAQTTVEVLASPATMELTVSRAMDLEVTLKPDPEHGEAEDPSTAIWPAIGENWQITVTYKGGTTLINKGKMPGTNSNAPIVTRYTKVPMGGTFKVSGCIYSKDGWLCGKWESDWQEAMPDSSGIKKVTGSIIEILVPLTQDVQYEYKEKIVYKEDSAKYEWKESHKPTETIKELNKSGVGNYLCQLINITYNKKEKQIGYTWSASGEKLPPLRGGSHASIEYMVQNMSTLADDSLNKRYKAGEVGFTSQPCIAYDKFGNGNSNFVLDTSTSECHLRMVNLTDEKHGFDLEGDTLMSYGKFNQNHIDAMVIHPDGLAIGVNWQNSKMEILEIPEKPSLDSEAVIAQYISGKGFIEGKLQGPIAIKVSPTGKVLVLESLNRRIQAFDKYGNPVPSFKGSNLFNESASELTNELNTLTFTDKLQQVFNINGITFLFDMDNAYSDDLDAKLITDDLKQEFADHGEYLCVDKDADGNPTAYIEVIEHGKSWKLIDAGRGYTYDINYENDALSVRENWSKAKVEVEAANTQWTISTPDMDKAFIACIEPFATSKIVFYEYLSYMNLYSKNNSLDTYLDFSVEAKGYIYVLSYQNAGDNVSDYYLDLYNPDGSFLTRTPDEKLQPENPQHPNIAKFEVDEFRNIYALNFEKMIGKQGYVEPTISQWIPTPPLFSLDKSKCDELQSKDMTKISADFSANNHPLTEQAQIEIITDNTYYQITDIEVVNGATRNIVYDIIFCVNEYQVYKIFNPQHILTGSLETGDSIVQNVRVVTEDDPLILSKSKIYYYDKIIIKDGGQIKVNVDATLRVGELIKKDTLASHIKTYQTLLSEQMDFKRKYVEKHLKDRKVHKEKINTADYKDGFIISYDESRNSLLQINKLKVDDIATLKKLGGIPDEVFDYKLRESSYQYIEPWTKGNDLLRSSLSHLQIKTLCKAFEQYVYGDSKTVKSYEKVLNKLYFPMLINYFEGNDIVVSENSPLIIEGPTVVTFGKVLFEKRASAYTTGLVTVNADSYVSVSDNYKDAPKIVSTGNNGNPGRPCTDIPQPKKGANDGVKGDSGKNSCNREASNGEPGDKGADGNTGENGTRGVDGNEVQWNAGTISGYYNIYTTGGDGGVGGKGGKGGTGGKGGNSAGANGNCGASSPGKGGDGGKGGTGGDGGNGGDGGSIVINYYAGTPQPQFNILTSQEAKDQYNLPAGLGGVGGAGGDVGEAGKGGDNNTSYNGKDGVIGAQGKQGDPGKRGNIYINQKSYAQK